MVAVLAGVDAGHAGANPGIALAQRLDQPLGKSEAEPLIHVDGEFVSQSQAKISVLDHAALYGHGVIGWAMSDERATPTLRWRVRAGRFSKRKIDGRGDLGAEDAPAC